MAMHLTKSIDPTSTWCKSKGMYIISCRRVTFNHIRTQRTLSAEYVSHPGECHDLEPQILIVVIEFLPTEIFWWASVNLC